MWNKLFLGAFPAPSLGSDPSPTANLTLQRALASSPPAAPWPRPHEIHPGSERPASVRRKLSIRNVGRERDETILCLLWLFFWDKNLPLPTWGSVTVPASWELSWCKQIQSCLEMKRLGDLKLIASCLCPGPVPRDQTPRPSSRPFYESMKLWAQHIFLLALNPFNFLLIS